MGMVREVRSGPRVVDGMSAAIALLAATLDSPDASAPTRDDPLLALAPDDCPGLVDLFVGVFAVAHLLLLDLSAASGEPVPAPLQRIALNWLAAGGR
jgi:hypothetical protein